MYINLENEKIKYTGRIDRSNPQRPEFIFPASSVEIHFIGKSLKIFIENKNDYYRNFIGAVIDGEVKRFEVKKTGKTEIQILNEQEEKEHTILIYKALDGCHTFTLESMLLSSDAELLWVKDETTRKIEFYGDSITAGEITEALDYVGKEDPEHDGQYSNVWYSYAWMTARKLNAEIHDIAQGGVALLNGTGWYHEPNYMGIFEMWDHVHYVPKFKKQTKWDFSKFTPDVVVVAIGQNDSNPEDYMAEDYQGERSEYWRRKYKEFIKKLRKVYPDAWIILQTTLMIHHENWDFSIQKVCEELKDEKIKYYKYKRNSVGTPGHLRIVESEEMANELSAFIEKTCFSL